MTKVLVTESYLQDIADSIRSKNGTQSTYKPSEMSTAIDSISGGGITPTGTKSISITQNGTTTEDVTNYASAEITVNVSGGSTPTLQSKSVSYTPTTSSQSETVTADSGYDGLSSVAVTVDAVATGTEGTPTATKGNVSNNAVTVTPSVTNTQGYIQGSTKTGTAVTVQASELVSGTLNITANDTYDVTNYANAVVNVSGGGADVDIFDLTIPSGIIKTDVTTLGPRVLTGRTNITGVVATKATGQASYILTDATNLTVFDAPATWNTQFSNQSFANTKLNTLIVRKTSSIVPLGNINAFINTPFASGGSGGTIYVPSALISSYQTATNWSTLDGYGTVTWVAIEGSQYENYYADGTAIS